MRVLPINLQKINFYQKRVKMDSTEPRRSIFAMKTDVKSTGKLKNLILSS